MLQSMYPQHCASEVHPRFASTQHRSLSGAPRHESPSQHWLGLVHAIVAARQAVIARHVPLWHVRPELQRLLLQQLCPLAPHEGGIGSAQTPKPGSPTHCDPSLQRSPAQHSCPKTPHSVIGFATHDPIEHTGVEPEQGCDEYIRPSAEQMPRVVPLRHVDEPGEQIGEGPLVTQRPAEQLSAPAHVSKS